jgi:predicted unusual protein kinase regulating ubiquinone biosynthesis (AarF/ABC1/UbiB family)
VRSARRPRLVLVRIARLRVLGTVVGRRTLAALWLRLRTRRVDAARRSELERRFHTRSAEDVTAALGQLRGVAAKVGQLASYLGEGLPPAARATLAQLQADLEPMAPSLLERTLRAELGAAPGRRFARFDPEPVAAASIGQVHRATTWDSREVAVKVQYPGAADAITADLANAERLVPLVAGFALPGLSAPDILAEVRQRIAGELDYRREAAELAFFAATFDGHPTITVPRPVPELSTGRVLTMDWLDGVPVDRFGPEADEPTRDRAAETVFRFVQASVHRLGRFQGDLQPANVLFRPDGRVGFCDFGLVKHWGPGEWQAMEPVLDAVLDRNPGRTVAAMEAAGFIHPTRGLDPERVYRYVATAYEPYVADRFHFTPEFVRSQLAKYLDIRGPDREVAVTLDLPPSFVILDRVVWGTSSLLGRLGAEGPWRGIQLEYRRGADPVTDLGRAERRWAYEAGSSHPLAMRKPRARSARG